MANKSDGKKTKRPTAQKRMIQNAKRRDIARRFKSKVRTALKSFLKAVTEKNSAVAQESLQEVYSMADKAVKRGIFKKNKANRIKARYAAKAAAIR